MHAHTLTRLLNGSAHETQSLFAELLEYKGTGSKHLTQTCEVLKAYDTELAENRDKKSYRGKEIDSKHMA